MRRRLLSLTALVGVASRTMVTAAGVATSPAASSRTSVAFQAVPMATSLATPKGTWAAFAMGDLGTVRNTFWQLFELKSGTSRWTVETPPGFADNGGLVLTDNSTYALAVGMRPSELIRYTPTVVLTRRGGWAASALVPGPLVVAPDSFVASAKASYAVVSNHGGTILRANSRGEWTTVATTRALAGSTQPGRCEVAAVEAVAVASSATVFAGTECSAGDQGGVFVESGSSWRLVGPTLSPLSSGETRTVLRLVANGDAIVGLIETAGPKGNDVVAADSTTNGASWKVSKALQLPPGATVVSGGPAGANGEYVVWRGRDLEGGVSTNERTWTALPALPDGTATLAFASPHRVDALAENRSTFVDWQLDASASHWRRSQTIAVPIVYGSSG